MAVLLTADLSVRAGEKINITGPSEKLDLPKDPGKEVILPDNDYFRSRLSPGESGQGPALPQPGQPTLIRNPKLEDLMERRKNWIYESPNSLDRDQNLQDIFGVRKYDLDTGDKRPKSSAQRYLDAKQENAPPKKPSALDPVPQNDLRGRSDLDASGSLSRHEGPADGGGAVSGIIPELNPAPLFNWTTGPDTASRMGISGGRRPLFPSVGSQAIFGKQTVPGEWTGAANPQRPEVGRAWDPPRALQGRFGDPINDQADATRAVMNPISARKASVPPPELSQGPIGESFAVGSRIPSLRSEIPGFGKSGNFGLGAYKPPQPAAVSTPAPLPKPVILEIPRPQF